MGMVKILSVLLCLTLVTGFAIADTIFRDDFEGGTHGDYTVVNVGGEAIWEVVKLDGNSVYKVDGPAGVTCYSTIDGIADPKKYPEIWACVKFKSEDSGIGKGCAELGLLSDPENPFEGNWYFSTIEGDVGIDESWIAWHSRVPYAWDVGVWYNMKVAFIGGELYGKIWPVDNDEPADWNTSEVITTHLEEDGVGLSVYENITYFDDLIVADSEGALTMAVSPKEKLTSTWAEVKSPD